MDVMNGCPDPVDRIIAPLKSLYCLYEQLREARKIRDEAKKSGNRKKFLLSLANEKRLFNRVQVCKKRYEIAKGKLNSFQTV